MNDQNQTTACEHRALHFGSGGFYVMCSECGARWVAVEPAADTDIDYGRSSPLHHVLGQFHFVETSP